MAASGVPAGFYEDSDEEDGFMFGDECTAYNSEHPVKRIF
jgi:hypothetical protein